MTGAEFVLALISAVLGGGGLGAAIVRALANRKKVQADCVATLSEAYETRLRELSAQVQTHETKIAALQSTLFERESMIQNLQQENDDLREQLEKMSTAVKCRDKRVRELERQVEDLTKRLNAMNGEKGDEEST